MKLVIAGSRDLEISNTFLKGCIAQSKFEPVEVVSGGASGVDRAAKNLTNDRISTDLLSLKLQGKYIEFPADWNTHGRAAGPLRNRQMAEYGDALLLIWDGESRGSASMKSEMNKLGKPIFEVIIRKSNV